MCKVRCAGTARGLLPRQREAVESEEAFWKLRNKDGGLGLSEQGRSCVDHAGLVVRAEGFGELVKDSGDE